MLRISDINLCLMNKVITAPNHFPQGKDTSQFGTLKPASKTWIFNIFLSEQKCDVIAKEDCLNFLQVAGQGVGDVQRIP